MSDFYFIYFILFEDQLLHSRIYLKFMFANALYNGAGFPWIPQILMSILF